MNFYQTSALIPNRGNYCGVIRTPRRGASWRFSWILMLVLLFPSLNYAQRLSFDYIGLKEGLPSTGAFDLIQDENGYIWIATLNGLVKYDGVDFQVFRGSGEDSLSSRPIGRSFVSLLQSKDGSIWTSTLDDGISHYLPEKKKFANYPVRPDSIGGLDFPRHEFLFEDSRGRIWMYGINSTKRIAKYRLYQPAQDTFYTFEVEPRSGQRLLKDGYIVEGNNGDIWAHDGANGNIYLFDPQKNEFQIRLTCNNIPSTQGPCNQINHLRIDESNLLWISTDKGLFVFDTQSGNFEQHSSLFQEFPFLNESPVFYSYQDQEGNIWTLAEGRSLVRYHFLRAQGEEFPLQQSPFKELGSESTSYIIKPVLRDEQGIWFINDMKKFAVYNRDFFYYKFRDNQLSNYGKTFRQAQNKPNEVPSAFLLDKSGLMWIANIGAGINKENPISQQIDSWIYGPDNAYNLSTDTLSSVKEDKEGNIWILGKNMVMLFDEQALSLQAIRPQGCETVMFNTFIEGPNNTLWVGSDKGLYRMDRSSQILTLEIPYTGPGKSGIEPLLIDKEGHLWIKYLKKTLGKYYGTALAVFDMDQGRLIQKFVHTPEDSTSLVSKLIREVYLDSKGRIWIASFDGLCRFDPINDRFIQYRQDLSDSTAISSNYISFFYEDSQQNIWIGTLNRGLNRYLEEPDGFQKWYDSDQFSVVLSALEDQEGQMWFGTERGEGLYRMSEEYVLDTFYNRTSGLASDVVSKMVGDDFGYFWIPSEKGITRFNPKDGSSTIFDENDGFDPFGIEEHSQFARLIQSQSGEIWLNSYDKLYRLVPRHLLAESGQAPLLHLSSLKIGDQTYDIADGEILTAHISKTDRIELAHHQNELTFEFIALHYALPSENRIMYMLEGIDHEWIEAGNDRQARYAGLPPGSYTLKAKAANAGGKWTEEMAVMSIRINHAWWDTPTAYAAYVLILALSMLFLVKWSTRKQKEKLKTQEQELQRERQLTEQLKSVDLLKDQFLANTSHELRTPLNGIIGLSEGVYDRSEDEEDRGDLSLIINSGKRLHYLVDDILDFSKLKKGELELELLPVNLNSVVELICRMSKPAIQKKNLTLSHDTPDSLPAVKADMHRLQQILYNLIGNAIKFTENGGVNISAEQVGNTVKISISDTGIGIPEAKMEEVFMEFKQGDGSTSRKFGGTGLGLTITKRLVELHGGQIGVESQQGTGSTFWFTLLASTEEGLDIFADQEKLIGLNSTVFNGNFSQGTSQSPEKEEVLSDYSPVKVGEGEIIRILIVDDESVNQRVMENHLDGERFELAFADDGDKALRLIEESPMFDLVLLDVMMPNMSGYEVCRRIREKHLPSELPIIMVTAKNQVSDLVSGLNRGANDYLAKPFSKQEFLARVKTQIDLHHIFSVADRYIPNEFIKALGHERITEVSLGDLIEMVVSVLFTDIRDYTTLSEVMSPEDTFRFISGYTRRMGPIIKKNRGFVNQYLGDGIMAIFQYCVDDALDAMIGMQKRLKEYNLERVEKDRPEISVGMGLHIGPLIMGIIGDKTRRDAATISDTVNTAARMEGLTKSFGVKILITGESYQNLINKTKYHFRYLGKVSVKGKEKSLDAWECMDADSPEEIQAKLEVMKQFDQMVEHYQQKRFKQALDIAESILEINPADKVVQYYHTRVLGKQENIPKFD